MFIAWIWGGGYPLGPKQKFRGGDAFTHELARDKTIGDVRRNLLGQALNQGMNAPAAKEAVPFFYKDRGPEPGSPWWRLNTPRGVVNDVLGVVTNGKSGTKNYADAFLGSYTGTAQIKAINRNNGTVRMRFTATNLSDWNSATHLIPRTWNPMFEKTFGAAVREDFSWEERLPLNRCGCWVE
ncbi:hypothetical protein [Streptomyces sp. NPDC051286]